MLVKNGGGRAQPFPNGETSPSCITETITVSIGRPGPIEVEIRAHVACSADSPYPNSDVRPGLHGSGISHPWPLFSGSKERGPWQSGLPLFVPIFESDHPAKICDIEA